MTGAVAAIAGDRLRITELGAFSGGTVALNSDGTSTASGSAPNWFTPTTGGIGASHWVRVTRTGGTGGVNFNPVAGTWHALSAGQTFGATGGAGNCQGDVEFATDSGGSTIVARGTISVNNAL